MRTPTSTPLLAAGDRWRRVRVRFLAVPTIRSVEWTAPVAATALAVVTAGSPVVLYPDEPLHAHLVSLRLAMVVLGIGAGLALGDPSEATVAAAPTPRRHRWMVRMGVIGGAWAVGWAVVFGIAATAGGPTPAAALSVEAAGWLAVSLLLARVGGAAAGVGGAVALAIALPLLPARIAVLPAAPVWSTLHARWLVVSIVAVALVVVSFSDPPARG